MSITEQIDQVRTNIKKDKTAVGQYFTPLPIATFMASLFHDLTGTIKLLDPGCGLGALSAAFVEEVLKRNETESLKVIGSDLDPSIKEYFQKTLELCKDSCDKASLPFTGEFRNQDYILEASQQTGENLLDQKEEFSHVIMNPPYLKISSKSQHRQALSYAGIETVNLYTGFLALALKQLRKGGELVAIIPRSFCNGPYYKPFREQILQTAAIQQIHIFDSRKKAFADDDVLQENIIIHLQKGVEQKEVIISSSPGAKFYWDASNQQMTCEHFNSRKVPFDKIVLPEDGEKFIYISPKEEDQAIIEQMAKLNTRLPELELQVSTGPVVDFRLKEDLRQELEPGTVPLLYPIHLNGAVAWPKDSKKPNAIAISENSERWLWKNENYFVLVRRFSSKEEKKRINATLYNGELPGGQIGFDNKLNVFHWKKQGISSTIAKGLYVYLNSSLLDAYFRLFSGHTQVNATDLKNIPYPALSTLQKMGKLVPEDHLTQEKIDTILEDCLLT